MAFLLNPGNKFNILLLKGQAHNFLDYNLFGFVGRLVLLELRVLRQNLFIKDQGFKAL